MSPKKKYDYKGVKLKGNTVKRLNKFRNYILKYGTEQLINNMDSLKDYELKSVSYDNLINLLIDIINIDDFE